MGGNEGEFGIRNNTFELLFWLTTMPNLVESGEKERSIHTADAMNALLNSDGKACGLNRIVLSKLVATFHQFIVLQSSLFNHANCCLAHFCQLLAELGGLRLNSSLNYRTKNVPIPRSRTMAIKSSATVMILLSCAVIFLDFGVLIARFLLFLTVLRIRARQRATTLPAARPRTNSSV